MVDFQTTPIGSICMICSQIGGGLWTQTAKILELISRRPLVQVYSDQRHNGLLNDACAQLNIMTLVPFHGGKGGAVHPVEFQNHNAYRAADQLLFL